MVGSGVAFTSPPDYFHSYENSCFTLCLESSANIRDSSRKIVEKIPPSSIMGDFCWESSEALSTKLLVVVSLDRNIISDNLKNQKILFHCHERGFFILQFTILLLYCTSSLLPGGARSFYSITFFLYEKSLFRTSLLEASLDCDSNMHDQKASREAVTPDRQRKIPSDMGIFQRSFYTCLFRRQEYYIR